jgi:DNA polymerase-3 subunit delta
MPITKYKLIFFQYKTSDKNDDQRFFQHDPAEPIGVWREIKEDQHGLFVRGQLLPDIARSGEVLCLMREGALDGLSIGFRTIKGRSDKKGGVWVRFFEPNIRDGMAVLQQKSIKIGLDIDHYALQHLMLLLNNNLALCANELEKLAILGIKITSKDIDKLVYSAAPLAIEQLLIRLFNKEDITSMITQLLDLGEDEASLLRSTQYFVNQIFLFHAYIKLNGHVDSAAILGYKLPKQIEDQKAQLALRVKSAALLKIFEHLLESEIAMKKAPATQREVLLYSMLIKIQGYL